MSDETNAVKHTPGPWVAEGRDVWAGPAGVGHICVFSAGLTPDPSGHANAERSAACVNACKGINPEAVPELLRALRACVDSIGSERNPTPAEASARDMALSAIAKAKGGAE